MLSHPKRFLSVVHLNTIGRFFPPGTSSPSRPCVNSPSDVQSRPWRASVVTNREPSVDYTVVTNRTTRPTSKLNGGIPTTKESSAPSTRSGGPEKPASAGNLRMRRAGPASATEQARSGGKDPTQRTSGDIQRASSPHPNTATPSARARTSPPSPTLARNVGPAPTRPLVSLPPGKDVVPVPPTAFLQPVPEALPLPFVTNGTTSCSGRTLLNDSTCEYVSDAVLLFWKPPSVFSHWIPLDFEVLGVRCVRGEQFLMSEKLKCSETTVASYSDYTTRVRLHGGPTATSSSLTTALWDTGSPTSFVSDSVVKSMIEGGPFSSFYQTLHFSQLGWLFMTALPRKLPSPCASC